MVDAAQVIIDAVERAEMDREHDALDDLLKPALGLAEGEGSKVS